ncbi:Cro/CI family transcriptional regulator [Arsukibacterium indicum]|uniref:Cro/Cl family transcriptional regulator n=1 Tax=Arsukibacterium indicum TaxID=2848612 RepID=A0ABS6MIM8_9GAMM|nr:Cro/CI family transcriptional regulator [Arsukibacterium indicum]MBV2128186.1 Cro/Cl family transcriptional regulator [Arsukibacterium indicum]
MKKQTVLDHFGGTSATAKALGITPASVSLWVDLVPKVRAYQLERMTKGKLRFNESLYQKPANAA